MADASQQATDPAPTGLANDLREQGKNALAEGQRHLITKRGSWLRQPLRRWCMLENDELIYYAKRDGTTPKGRIPLKECTLTGSSQSSSASSKSRATRSSSLEIQRKGKAPFEIHADSTEELRHLAALVQLANGRHVPSTSTAAAAAGAVQGAPSHQTVVAAASPGSVTPQETSTFDGVLSGERLAPTSPAVMDSSHHVVLQDQAVPRPEAANVEATGRSAPPAGKPSGKAGSHSAHRNCDFIFGHVINRIGRCIHEGLVDEGVLVEELPAAPTCREAVPCSVGAAAAATAAAVEEQPRTSVRSQSRSEEAAVPPDGGAGIPLPASSREDGAGALELAASEDAPEPAQRFPSTARPRSHEQLREPEAALSPGEAYREALEQMWNYDLDRASKVLKPWRESSMWHAGAYAECWALRVILTGRRSEAQTAMELVRAAEALCEAQAKHYAGDVCFDVFCAELLLLRSTLQVILGSRFRALLNLRQCWYQYRRLEHIVCHVRAGGGSASPHGSPANAGGSHPDSGAPMTARDMEGRICFGLGVFYLVTSMLPVGLCPFIRLAGFRIDRELGKAYLRACADRDMGPRATLAAILIAMYHLDLEPDIPTAGHVLVRALQQKPENVLLHWAGSVLAWRNTCILEAVDQVQRALWCCGEDLSSQAIYLRYELGMFYIIQTSWNTAHFHLRYVHDAVQSDRIFFPYKLLVTTQLAAVCFNLGYDEEGEALCQECVAAHDWGGALEGDFAKVVMVFLKRRVLTRRLLAFEVMYLLRQFPRVPAPMLENLHDHITDVGRPYELQFTKKAKDEAVRSNIPGPAKAESGANERPPDASTSSSESAAFVEHVSAQVMQCIVLFYLGDVSKAMTFVPQLALSLTDLPPWSSYLCVHGLYWCGRIFALSSNETAAVRCLQQAKSYKKYPFNISSKVSKVLETLQSPQRH